jgi:hypothetical protein
MKIPELMEKFVADFIQDYEKLDLKSTEEILKY